MSEKKIVPSKVIESCKECPFLDTNQADFPRGELGRTYYCLHPAVLETKIESPEYNKQETGNTFSPACPLETQAKQG